MSNAERPSTPVTARPANFLSPKAVEVSAVMTRWPEQAFTVDDITAIGYADELAAAVEAAGDAVPLLHPIRSLAQSLMSRAALQRFVEGDGFYLQEGTILAAYNLPGHKPGRKSVWRATSAAYPSAPGLQTTDDFLIAWDKHKRPRSAPLLRESVGISRLKSLVELFASQPGETFSMHDVAASLYLDEGNMSKLPALNEAEHQLVQRVTYRIRSALYRDGAREQLETMLAERGFQLLEGQIIGNAFGENAQKIPPLSHRLRSLFRAVPLGICMTQTPEQYRDKIVQWRRFGAPVTAQNVGRPI